MYLMSPIDLCHIYLHLIYIDIKFFNQIIFCNHLMIKRMNHGMSSQCYLWWLLFFIGRKSIKKFKSTMRGYAIRIASTYLSWIDKMDLHFDVLIITSKEWKAEISIKPQHFDSKRLLKIGKIENNREDYLFVEWIRKIDMNTIPDKIQSISTKYKTWKWIIPFQPTAPINSLNRILFVI